MIYSTSSNTIIYGEQVDGSCPSSGQNQSRFADGTTTQKIKCMSTGDLSRPITGCAGQIAVTWLRSRDHYLTFTWLLYIGLLLTCTFSSAHELRTSCLSHGEWQTTRLLSRNYFINNHISIHVKWLLRGVTLRIEQARCITLKIHGVLHSVTLCIEHARCITLHLTCTVYFEVQHFEFNMHGVIHSCLLRCNQLTNLIWFQSILVGNV